MAQTALMFTLLPTGVQGNTLKFSVYLSPQLGHDGVLGDFPNFVHFTELAQTLALTVTFAGAGTIPSQTLPLNPDFSKLQLGFWGRLFPPTTLVKAFSAPNQTNRTLRSYSVRAVKNSLLTLYSGIATNPAYVTDHPPLTGGTPVRTFINSLSPINTLLTNYRSDKNGGSTVDQYNARLDGMAASTIPSPSTASTFYQAFRFFTRPPQKLTPDEILPRPDPSSIDFHQAVALLVDHGQLLRKLGLVIDGTVTIPPGTSVPITSTVQVASVTLATSLPPVYRRPITNYVIANGQFIPRALSGSEMRAGMLQLGNTAFFDAFEVDIDGAAMKTTNFGVSMSRELAKTANNKVDKPTTASLPALRTGGFMLSRNGRAANVMTNWSRSADFPGDPDNAHLYAEDLTRGYRFDVLHDGEWRSLCHRRGSVTVGQGTSALTFGVDSLANPLDEGYVKGPSGTSGRGPNVDPSELYLHEALVTWKGWSLAVPRPGRVIQGPPDNSLQPLASDATATAFAIAPEYRPQPGTLPRLRFGDQYAFRARLVDLAGNSLPPDAVPPVGMWQSPTVPYLRYEPIASPALAPRTVYAAGESLETIVVRSQVAVPGDVALNPAFFNPLSSRHVLPPKVSQQMAEQHGAFDGYFDTGVDTDRALAFRISCKEAGTLMSRQIVDPYDTSFDPAVFPAKLVDVTEIALVDPSQTPSVIEPSDTAKWPQNPGDPLQPGQYVIHRAPRVALPYLPDPLARGVTLSNETGVAQIPFAFNGSGSWPDLQPFRLVLAAADAAGAGALTNGDYEIRLPPGTMARVRYSSYTDAAGLAEMAFGQNLPAGTVSDAALEGRHWMLTPYREIMLVHAVEQPIIDPTVVVGATKTAGATYASLTGVITSHSESTGEADLYGHWTDHVDRLTDDAPTIEEHDGRVFGRRIDYLEPNAQFPKTKGATPPKHEFGDTKHHSVSYRIRGKTRYAEFFPPEVTSEPSNITRVGPVTALINIRSSARPLPPRVLYAVPTFRWSLSSDGRTSKRTGRALRVYLDRPWYSSGNGESLGAVIAINGITSNLRAYVSEWAADPAWNDAPPTQDLIAGNFSNRIGVSDVHLAELPDQVVRVVNFGVPAFDDTRKLWYADIEMTMTGFYFPFVRLALARFQPDSVTSPDLRLSNVVKTEFSQLVPDRTLVATPNLARVHVVVSGQVSLNERGTELLQPVLIPPTSGMLYPNAGAGHVVKAHIERRPKVARSDGHQPLDWVTIGETVTLQSYFGTPTQFRGDLPWTGSNRDPSFEYRLVVTEHELYKADADGTGAQGQRLAYLDIVNLTP